MNKEELLDLIKSNYDSKAVGLHIWVQDLRTGTKKAAIADITGTDGIVAIWAAGADGMYKSADYGKTWIAMPVGAEKEGGI